MRFRYPLQKLVDLKTNEKEQAEWKLSEAIGALQREELSLSELLAEHARVGEELESASVRKTTISQIQSLQQYMEYLNMQIRCKSVDVEKAQENVSDKRLHLNEKMIEEKVWAKAKERAQLQFTSFVLKKEQEELDEIALTRRIQTI